MGDRAPGSFTVYTCPDQCTANKIINLAESHQMAYDWGTAELDNTLRLGEMICDDEMSLGEDDLIAQALQAYGVIAKVMQDAKYEYDGTVYYTHPTLGRFDATGSQGGEVMVPASLLHRAIQHNDPPDLVRAIEQLTGKAWENAIAEAEKALLQPGATLAWTYDDEHDCITCEGGQYG